MTYALTPITAPAPATEFPPVTVRVINIVTDPAICTVSRGTGEKSNTITIGPPPPPSVSFPPVPPPPPPPPADPFGAYVLLLLHLDGVDGGTLFPDDSGTHKTITFLSVPPTTSTDLAKFGSSVGKFPDAAGSVLLVVTPSEGAQFGFTTGDFTIEMWVYRTSAPTNSVLFRWGDVNSQHPYSLYINNLGPGSVPKFNFYGWDDGGSVVYQLFSTTTVELGTWYFVQARRSGDTMALAVNGVQEASASLAPGTVLYDNGGTKAGAGDYPDGAGVRFHGYLDELRVTRAARPFALQTEIFPNP